MKHKLERIETMKYTDKNGNEYNMDNYDLMGMCEDLLENDEYSNIIFLYTFAEKLMYPNGFKQEMTEKRYMINAIKAAVVDMAKDEDISGLRWVYTMTMNYLTAKGNLISDNENKKAAASAANTDNGKGGQ